MTLYYIFLCYAVKPGKNKQTRALKIKNGLSVTKSLII